MRKQKNAFEQRSAFKLVVPLCCFEVFPKRGMLRWLSRLTLQYVLLNPLTAFIAIGLQVQGSYCDGELTNFDSGYPYISFITFVSVTVAMYALILFYVVAKDELKPFHVMPKFLSIKFIIMLSFWQSLVVAGLVKINVIHNTASWTSDNISTGVQNALICFEMLIVAIWHLFAFRYQEFSGQGAEKTPVWKSLAVCFNYLDVGREIYASFFSVVIHSLKKDNNNDDDGGEAALAEKADPPTPKTPLSPKVKPPFQSVILV